MNEYNAGEFIQRALSGDWRAQITVLTRSSINPEVLVAIMQQSPLHQEVQLAIIGRRDATVDQLELVAQRTESAVVLNRIVGDDRTPVETVGVIRERAVGLEGDIWRFLAQHADRVLARRAGEGPVEPIRCQM